ncbi:hypothetical protein [Antarcticimicrobium luteum]|uniref:Uncharacterized protein n=1 Tax=Antarcticimicrobium luteum TaxID=2547397 RepID=A0A4R5UTI6_9RHOB|nr:hypothetical protein [Antarcticimicrobium luteum]TDK42351.1 hypothetical protein E1832_19645 [Antarcticimicrobium luteum]
MFPLMLYLSLGANVAITLPLTWMALRGGTAICTVLGPDSPSRRLLACLFATVTLLSLLGLYAWPTGHDETAMAVLLGLLPTQILWSLMAVPALPRNPLLWGGLALSALHGVTLSVVL